MKPYFEQDGITVYHGDCRDVLPHVGRFDLCLTDPPYGIGIGGAGRIGGAGLVEPRDYGDCTWDEAPLASEHWGLCVACSERQIGWGYNHLSDVYGPCKGMLVWDKKCRNDWDDTFSDHESAYSSHGKAAMFRHLWVGALNDSRMEEGEREHPTQKPVALMLWCISKANNPQSVIDPFLGSGTTLVACKKLGIRGVGIEREERYCEIAVKRILNTTPSLFQEVSA